MVYDPRRRRPRKSVRRILQTETQNKPSVTLGEASPTSEPVKSSPLLLWVEELSFGLVTQL